MDLSRRDTRFIILITLMAVAIIALAAVVVRQHMGIVELRQQADELTTQRRSLIDRTNTLQSRLDDSLERIEQLEGELDRHTPPDDLGELPPDLPRAEADRILVDDLLSRGTEIINEVIGAEGVLGGTMGFYVEENIDVLNDRWVFARFEDGHIGGEALLRYRFIDREHIEWSLLEVTDY